MRSRRRSASYWTAFARSFAMHDECGVDVEVRLIGPRSVSRSRSSAGCGVDVEVRLTVHRSATYPRSSFGCGVDAE
eukprot:60221-Pyramimonas_sp.AAC.1